MNISGKSQCRVNNQAVEIEESHFFISNSAQSYSLEIENDQPVETFNIHIGNRLVSEVLSTYRYTHSQLLDQPFSFDEDRIFFFNRLNFKDPEFNSLIKNIYHQHKEADALWIEEQLAFLVEYLLRKHQSHLKEKARLPLIRVHSREEIYRRLSMAVNYLHAHYLEVIDLDSLSQIACLSKFHFLRLFKEAFGFTPHQYIIHLRLEKAKSLLATTLLNTTEITYLTGFQNVSSFCRLFQRKLGCSPLQYRQGA